MQGSLYLAFAILTEIIGTSALKASDGFSKMWPTLVAVIGYIASSYLLAMALKSIPIGVLYAIWSGVGIVAVTVIGWLYFHQKLDIPAIAGISLVTLGVLVINLFSNTKTIID